MDPTHLRLRHGHRRRRCRVVQSRRSADHRFPLKCGKAAGRASRRQVVVHARAALARRRPRALGSRVRRVCQHASKGFAAGQLHARRRHRRRRAPPRPRRCSDLAREDARPLHSRPRRKAQELRRLRNRLSRRGVVARPRQATPFSLCVLGRHALRRRHVVRDAAVLRARGRLRRRFAAGPRSSAAGQGRSLCRRRRLGDDSLLPSRSRLPVLQGPRDEQAGHRARDPRPRPGDEGPARLGPRRRSVQAAAAFRISQVRRVRRARHVRDQRIWEPKLPGQGPRHRAHPELPRLLVRD
mmetsp:Transcript_12433/g.41422  ORF Transcript_12433/g.41422 Transcript_12433/m.41422 type:complete len:297 (-) Transcript_12433:168-1058(-)